MQGSQIGGSPQGRTNRRSFLSLLTGLMSLGWLGAIFYPVYRYLKPKPDAGVGQIDFVEAGKVSEYPINSWRLIRFGTQPALVIRGPDGQFHAFFAKCTHLGCTVQYQPGQRRIYCACHGGVYDLATGKNVAGPPPRPLARLNPEVVNGSLFVVRPGARTRPQSAGTTRKV
ncbi:MAG: QcrA and Rieske domain-containing protein [Armatimonadota bacterium]